MTIVILAYCFDPLPFHHCTQFKFDQMFYDSVTVRILFSGIVISYSCWDN